MECVVTDVIEINSKKVRVILDNDIQFALYKSEVRRFHITVGELIESKYYENIINELLPKRARERCLNLLARRNMTVMEIRNKLRDGYYPEFIIDEVVNRLLLNKLLDDENYASMYVESHSKTKSKRQMMQYLLNKGISRECLDNIFRGSNVDEEEGIRILMNKKHIDLDVISREELNKFCMFLMRRGYSYDLIRKMIL